MDFARAKNDSGELIIPKAVKPPFFYLLVPVIPIDRGNLVKRKGVGTLDIIDRQLKIDKFREKRRLRAFAKKIRYLSRQEQAAKRERIKGKFVKCDNCHSRKTTKDEEELQINTEIGIKYN